MKRLIILGGLAAVAISVFATSASWSGVSSSDTTSASGGGTGMHNGQGGHQGGADGPAVATPTHVPFTPYDIGSGAGWAYGSLTADEQVVALQGLNTTGWDKTNAAFASAATQQSAQAATQAAQSQLGVGDLGQQGVIP